MTAKEILEEIRPMGNESYKRVIFNHGVKEPCFGVKIGDMQKIQKRAKKDYQLALDLYDTGIYDAQYLAGLIADETKMSRKDLTRWLKKGNSATLCGYVVAWVTAESAHGMEMAREWIDSKEETTAQTGWATLSSVVAITDDSKLNLAELKQLLARVEKTIHQQPNEVRSAMNGF